MRHFTGILLVVLGMAAGFCGGQWRKAAKERDACKSLTAWYLKQPHTPYVQPKYIPGTRMYEDFNN